MLTMMMMMRENYTMPVTGPCDSNFQILKNLCSELSFYGSTKTTKKRGRGGGGGVLTIYQSGKRGGGGQDTDSQHDTLGGCGWIPATYTALGFPKTIQ
jgi:hypothetical protein